LTEYGHEVAVLVLTQYEIVRVALYPRRSLSVFVREVSIPLSDLCRHYVAASFRCWKSSRIMTVGVADRLATSAPRTSLIANYYSVMNYNELLIRATALYHTQQRSTAIVSVFGILNWL
jgi:hypothetical protein